MPGNLWNIVLAAGRGSRLSSVTGGVPKQFWSRDGRPTLLEDTLDRIAGVAPPDRTVIVVDDTHRAFVESLPGLDAFKHILYQPTDKGTAAGVLLGLGRVSTIDPNAVVLLTPSDHGVGSPAMFVSGVRRAVRDVRAGRRDVVLFGAAPDTADVDYGWILPAPDPVAAGRFQRVAAFAEKPPEPVARELLSAGAVWNTMVLTARASSLLRLFERHLPALTAVFLEAIDRGVEDGRRFLQAQYHGLPAADFSRDLVGATEALSVHTWPVAMGWSDLGTPDRLASWVMSRRSRSGARSAFHAAEPEELRVP
jgi:mannose-1-phosphate guanylyltransferase